MPTEPISTFIDKGSGRPHELPAEEYRFFEFGEDYDPYKVDRLMLSFREEFSANTDEKPDSYPKRLSIDFSNCWRFEPYYASMVSIYERWKEERKQSIEEYANKLGDIYRKVALSGSTDVGQFIYSSSIMEDISEPEDRELAENYLAQINGLRLSAQTYQWHINNIRAIQRLIRETRDYVSQFAPASQNSNQIVGEPQEILPTSGSNSEIYLPKATTASSDLSETGVKPPKFMFFSKELPDRGGLYMRIAILYWYLGRTIYPKDSLEIASQFGLKSRTSGDQLVKKYRALAGNIRNVTDKQLEARLSAIDDVLPHLNDVQKERANQDKRTIESKRNPLKNNEL